MKFNFFITSFLLFFIGIFSVSFVSGNNSLDDYTNWATVTSVYDGDTFTVLIDGKLEKEKIRIIGIDTPEIKKGSKSTCLGKEVANYTKEYLQGKRVLLIRDKKTKNRDNFGRLLRNIRVEGKVDIGKKLILKGYASVYEKEDFKWEKRYLRYQNKIKNRKKGIWNEFCFNDSNITNIDKTIKKSDMSLKTKINTPSKVDPLKTKINTPSKVGPSKTKINTPSKVGPSKTKINTPSKVDPLKTKINTPSKVGPSKTKINTPSKVGPSKTKINTPSKVGPSKTKINTPSKVDPLKTKINTPSKVGPSKTKIIGKVKKSKNSGTCHDKKSRWFKRTKYYIWYNTMEDCIQSGGKHY
jgi:endonuclease YncB( thermonuclease family)